MLGAEPPAIKPPIGALNHSRLSRQYIRPKSQDASSYRPVSPVYTFQNVQPNVQQINLMEKENDPLQLADNNDVSTIITIDSEHQVACPRFRVKKLKSRENTRKEELHPRAWGVRSPKEIQCTCKISKHVKKNSRSLNINPSPITHKDISQVGQMVDNFCRQIEKLSVSLLKDDVTEYINKIRKSLESRSKRKAKSVEKLDKTTTNKDPNIKKGLNKDNKNSWNNPLNKQQHQQQQQQQQQENIVITNQNLATYANSLQPSPTTAAVVGKLESTNYVFELSTQPGQQGPGEIKTLMSQVIPMVDKPKLVAVDGAYFAEVPNDYVSKVSDNSMMRKRTENVTFYTMTDQKQQNLLYAKPKSPFSNPATKYVPVTKITGMPIVTNANVHHTNRPISKK